MTADDVALALWEIPNQSSPVSRHVFFTHGTFSDRRICLGLARHLARRGHHCWVLEWRGHGASQRPAEDFNFETVALHDVKAALAYLIERRGITQLDCVTHSGGGIVLAMYLARHPTWRPYIGNVALFACQSCHAGFSPARRGLMRAMKTASQWAGYVPGRRLGIGIQDESSMMMGQWFDWNITGRFEGRDGFDYLAAMHALQLPALAVFGKGDRFIAPPSACRRFLAALGHPDSRELHGAVTEGYSQDFNHAGILHSAAARSEIWPQVQAWLER